MFSRITIAFFSIFLLTAGNAYAVCSGLKKEDPETIYSSARSFLTGAYDVFFKKIAGHRGVEEDAFKKISEFLKGRHKGGVDSCRVLARETLSEISGQFVLEFKDNNEFAYFVYFLATNSTPGSPGTIYHFYFSTDFINLKEHWM